MRRIIRQIVTSIEDLNVYRSKDWKMPFEMWARRPLRGLVQSLCISLFRSRLCWFRGHRVSGRPPSSLFLAVKHFLHVPNLLSDTMLRDRILWIYVCQTDSYISEQTTVNNHRKLCIEKQLRSRLFRNTCEFVTRHFFPSMTKFTCTLILS